MVNTAWEARINTETVTIEHPPFDDCYCDDPITNPATGRCYCDTDYIYTMTVRERYTEGECHGLAFALAQLTGGTVEPWIDAYGIGHHIFVRLADGRLMDIDGPRIEEIAVGPGSEWQIFHPITIEEAKFDEWEAYDVDAAAVWAQTLVTTFPDTVRSLVAA